MQVVYSLTLHIQPLHKNMQPIDKFTNIDAVYPTLEAKEEDDIFRLCLAVCMIIHPAMPKEVQGGTLEGSEAMPTFKERYNNRLIEMPLTYEEYKKDKEIQTAYQLCS